MGIPIGMDLRTWAKLESAYDTISAFAATDAVPLLELTFTPKHEYHRSREHVGTAGLVSEIKGISGGTWTAKSYVKPNAPGTAPDVGDMLRAAMGGAPVTVADTSVLYPLSSSDPPTLQLARAVGTSLYEVVTGAWVEELTIELSGNKEPEITWSGGYATHGWVYGNPVIADEIASGATFVTLPAAHKGKIGKGTWIKIGADSNGGTGYLTTYYDPTNGRVGISPVLGTTQSAPVTILPHPPGQTLAGTIAGGVGAAMSFDAGTTWLAGLLSAKLSVKTGFHGLDKEATAYKPTGVARGKREITIECSAYVREDVNAYAGRAFDGLIDTVMGADASYVILRIGDYAAGRHLKISVPLARIDISPLKIPDEDEATFDLKLIPRRLATNDDELSLFWD